MRSLLKGKVARLLALGVCAFIAAGLTAAPQVVVTIKPLHLIAKDIAGDDIRLNTLLPVTASPHQYPLKVSDYQLLDSADLVIWVGPELESFLAKSVARRQGSTLTLLTLDGLSWPSSDQPDHHHDHAHAENDPHIWLDPHNALIIAAAMAKAFTQLAPEQEAHFNARLNAFSDRVNALTARITETLEPVSEEGFAVYHEGFGHFVKRFNLHQVGYITITPEQRSGAKHLAALDAVVEKEGVCVFQEPYADTKQIARLAEKYALRVGTLDGLGVERVDTYEALLSAMADAFATCLSSR